MKLSQAIRKGRKKVARQGFRGFFAWDARYPRWRLDKYPPNSACAVGMALLAEGWAPWGGHWTAAQAGPAAEIRWGQAPVSLAIELNDREQMRWDRIARRLEQKGW